MHAFLVKKVSLNNAILSISWSENDGYIAIGGTSGYLKVIRLQDKDQQNNAPLQYHEGNVNMLCWNDKFRKLTSVDDMGLIIVWTTHGGRWYEQMINNRNKSSVTDMKWSPDGQKICIVYEDGCIIMGSVEGSRLWGKEEKIKIAKMQWFPDSKNILLGTSRGEVLVYDEMGDLSKAIKMEGLDMVVPPQKFLCPDIPLAAIQWFKDSKIHSEDIPYGLCIAYKQGRMILMRNDRDDNFAVVDASIQISRVSWCYGGTVVAVGGVVKGEQDQVKGLIKFFDDEGNQLKNLRLPNCDRIECLSWDGSGLKMAVGYGSAFYVASVKPDYKWTYLTMGMLVFAYQKQDKTGFSVVFWNIKTNQKVIKQLKNLVKIKSCGEFIAMFFKGTGNHVGRTRIDLCNCVGTPIDSHFVNFEAIMFQISKTHICVANQNYVYLWHYKTLSSKGSLGEGVRKIGKETCWFINDKPNVSETYSYVSTDHDKEAQDMIYALTLNQNALYIAKKTGTVVRYLLPYITQDSKLFIKPFPQLIKVNCDNSRLCSTDINGTMTIHQFNSQGGNFLQIQRKDVWNFAWSVDHPEQLVFYQKNKMTILQGINVEKPCLTDALICEFKNLRVKGVYLDDIMKSPDGLLIAEDCFMEHQSDFYKDFVNLIKDKGISQGMKFAQANRHKHLWEIIAQKSLNSLDFREAERALLKIDDYKATKLLKKIQALDDKDKQRAEVMVYYGDFDGAQNLYKSIDRKDLAISMRVKIGDWFKLSQMMKEGSGFDDVLQKVNDQLGYYFLDKMDWIRAAEYFMMSKNYKELIEAFIKMEDYDSLAQIINQLPQNDPTLLELAERFKYAGLAAHAVKCYQRCGQPKMAVDCCILLNHWDLAIELAEKNKFGQIEGLLFQTANKLLQSNRKLQAAQLYRKANRNTEAAKILSGIANDLIVTESSPLTIKKLYVMAAIEVDNYKKRLLDQTMTQKGGSTTKTLDSLITSDINTSSQRILNNPWRGAEAWHFFLLVQRQLYSRQYKQALKSALRLVEYQYELQAKKIYTMLALAAYYNKSFKECSRAFFKLEGLSNISIGQRQRFQEIAVDIFTKHPPKDPPAQMFNCPGKACKARVSQYDTHCKNCGSNFQPCVLSGRSLLSKQYYSCKTCRHKMLQSQVQKVDLRYCALCHSAIDFKRFGAAHRDD